MIYGADPIKNICIDSKFPLENYQRMTNKDLSKELRTQAYKLFETGMQGIIRDFNSAVSGASGTIDAL